MVGALLITHLMCSVIVRGQFNSLYAYTVLSAIHPQADSWTHAAEEKNFIILVTFFGGVTNVTYHMHGSLVRNRGFQPQIIGDLRADLGYFPGQTYGGASGGLSRGQLKTISFSG